MTTASLVFHSLSTSNQRAARCARCGGRLPTGKGVAWATPLGNRVYLCPPCSDQQAEEERALEAAAGALAAIGKMLNWDRPLGFIDEERVRRAVRQAGMRGAQNATALAARIEAGERFTVWEACGLIADLTGLTQK